MLRQGFLSTNQQTCRSRETPAFQWNESESSYTRNDSEYIQIQKRVSKDVRIFPLSKNAFQVISPHLLILETKYRYV